MKDFPKIIILAPLFVWVTTQGQQNPINFDNGYLERIIIDTTDSDNLWQIGRPHKTLFDSSYSIPNAILTDTINAYTNNDTSAFYIYSPHMISYWPTLHFKYKIDADSLKDFGEIMASYDNGNTWIDIIKDAQLYDIEWFAEGKYLGGGNYETIAYYDRDSVPFTGTSNIWYRFSISLYGWDIHFPPNDTIIYRISFYSDNINTNQEGWMIDDIYTEDWISRVSEIQNFNSLTVYPNPCSDIVTLEANTAISYVTIYNLEGKIIQKQQSNNLTRFDLSSYSPGVYLYKVITEQGNIRSGKLIKK